MVRVVCYFLFINLIHCLAAQQHNLGIKMGMIDPDSFGKLGYNAEVSMDRSIKKDESRVVLGIQLGFAKENSFPDYFKNSFVFAENNDVIEEVDRRIRNLTIDEALSYGFSSYNVNYLRLICKYRFLTFLGIDTRAYTGVFVRNENSADFGLYRYSFENDRLLDYRSNYLVDHKTVIGWPLGLELSKKVSPNYHMNLDALYEIPFDGAVDSPVNFYIRAGFSRDF